MLPSKSVTLKLAQFILLYMTCVPCENTRHLIYCKEINSYIHVHLIKKLFATGVMVSCAR